MAKRSKESGIRLVQRKLSNDELKERVYFIDEVRRLEFEMAELDEVAVRARDRWDQLRKQVSKLRTDGEFSRCTAITLAGKLCKVRTTEDSWLCRTHEIMLSSDMVNLLRPIWIKRNKKKLQERQETLGAISKAEYFG
jgi:hypothetical protein